MPRDNSAVEIYASHDIVWLYLEMNLYTPGGIRLLKQ